MLLRDLIHGDIELTSVESGSIGLCVMQRLGGITLLGGSGAARTRVEAGRCLTCKRFEP